MTKEKQIEKMANIIALKAFEQAHLIDGDENLADIVATDLYEKGYRKASDVAREIFEEIENMIHAYINGFQTKGAYPVRKVICLEDNKVYETIGEAARAYNIHRETVRSSCVRLCKGRKHTFRYFDERREE